MLSSHIAAVIWRTPCFLNWKSRSWALSMGVFLDQKPPNHLTFSALSFKSAFPHCSSLPISCLSLLRRELALRIGLPVPVGRQRPLKADALFLTSPPSSLPDRSLPLPPPLQALPSHCILTARGGSSVSPACLQGHPLTSFLSAGLSSLLSFPSDPWNLYKWLLLGPKGNKWL